MKILKHFVLLLLSLVVFCNTNAQNRSLSVYALDPFVSSINSGSTDTALIVVKNIDTLTYTGQLAFSYTINGTGPYTGSAGDSSGFKYTTSASDTISPGDSIVLQMVILPNGPLFFTSPSVVVIWPISVSGNAINVVDSLNFEIEISGLVSIRDVPNSFLYYYNDRIYLRNNGEIGFKHVRIYDALGAVVHIAERKDSQYITLPILQAGLYIAEATLSNNKRTLLKFIKPLH